MNQLNFKYCPVCGEELDTGKIKFPSPYSFLDIGHGWYYSDKISEKYEGHPVKKLFGTYDKEFYVQNWGKRAGDSAGYCQKCGKIFAEFDVIGEYNLIGEETIDYYEESADSLYEDKIVSYDDYSDEKYDTIDGYTILTDNIKFKKSED